MAGYDVDGRASRPTRTLYAYVRTIVVVVIMVYHVVAAAAVGQLNVTAKNGTAILPSNVKGGVLSFDTPLGLISGSWCSACGGNSGYGPLAQQTVETGPFGMEIAITDGGNPYDPIPTQHSRVANIAIHDLIPPNGKWGNIAARLAMTSTQNGPCTDNQCYNYVSIDDVTSEGEAAALTKLLSSDGNSPNTIIVFIHISYTYALKGTAFEDLIRACITAQCRKIYFETYSPDGDPGSLGNYEGGKMCDQTYTQGVLSVYFSLFQKTIPGSAGGLLAPIYGVANGRCGSDEFVYMADPSTDMHCINLLFATAKSQWQGGWAVYTVAAFGAAVGYYTPVDFATSMVKFFS